MKLHDYNQMMSYMRRPGFQDGTVPLKKPESSFIDKLQTLKEMKGGLMPRSKVAILKMYMDEALKDGEITQDQYTEMLMPYFGELGENITEQIEVSDRENFAYGGTYKDYMSRGAEYKDLSFEEWLQEDKPGYKPSEFGRTNKAIGGGVIEGEDLGTREGFSTLAKQKASAFKRDKERAAKKEAKGFTVYPDGREYTEKPGRKRTIAVDDVALVDEWRKSLKGKNPTKWITFLKNKFDETTAESLRTRVRNNIENFNPVKEFADLAGDAAKETKLKTIQKLVDEHNNSDSMKYTQEDIFEQLGTKRLSYKDNPQEMAIISTMDKPEDKIKKAFDKIITEDMKLYDPKPKGNVKSYNIIYQMISDIASPKGGSARYQFDQRFIDKTLNTHEPYLNIKDDFDYFAKEAKPFIGKNFKEGFERAKFIRGGLDIKNLDEFAGGYAKPEKNIFNFALRHAFLNHKQGKPSEVTWYKKNKKGKKIGKPLNFDDLPRNVNTLARIFDANEYGFEYKGQFFDKNTLKTDAKKSGLFDEVYEITQKGQTLVPDPNNPDGPKITLRNLLQDTGDKLTVGHNDAKGGVAGSPFNDLRIEGGKFNVAMFNAYNSVKDPKARKMIINNLQGDFGNLKGEAYEKAFINAKSQLAKDMFNSPEAVLDLPTYYRGAAQKVLADTGKDFFSQSDAFKKEVARVANINLEEYEANKSSFKKNLVLQLAKKNNFSPERVEKDLTNVQKVIRKMQGQMNSGIDPKLLVEYLGAEVKDLAAFGSKYGGDALSKVGKGVAGIDLPIFQTIFGSMYDIEQESPLWLTIPAAFTDEVANLYGLYNKSEGRFGTGKLKDFGKFVASSFVPRAMRSPIFKTVSKVGKIGSLAAPVLELGKQAYLSEKRKGMLPDIAKQFDIPIEEAKRGYDNFVKQSQIRGMESMVDDIEIPEISKQGKDNLNSLINSVKQLGSYMGVSEDPYAEKESIYTRGIENPMSLDRVLYPNRQNFADGPQDPSKKGLGSFTRRNFLKLLSLIPAGILAVRGGPNLLKKTQKATEVLRRGADGIPDFINDLVTKVMTFGKKRFEGNRSDELEEVYQLDNYVVTKRGDYKTTIREIDQDGDMLYKENQMEIEIDPETGGVTYNEASARPDGEGKLKDVEEYIEESDLENMKRYTYDE